MFNNPFYNNFKEQQPIQNIINTQMPLNNVFMAQFLKKGERAEEMFVNHKTAFIDINNKELIIKEIDGTIITYGLILPKDDKDLKIEELEKQIIELKGMIEDERSNENDDTNYEISEQKSNVTKSTKTKSTIK